MNDNTFDYLPDRARVPRATGSEDLAPRAAAAPGPVDAGPPEATCTTR